MQGARQDTERYKDKAIGRRGRVRAMWWATLLVLFVVIPGGIYFAAVAPPISN